MGRNFYIRVREQVAFLQIRRGQRCLLTQKTSFSRLNNLEMEYHSGFLRLQVQSLQHAMLREETEIITTTARAHAMPDIQIERDPRHRRPLPEAEQKRGEGDGEEEEQAGN